VSVFLELLENAVAQPMTGWDFSWLGERPATDDPPWEFTTIVTDLARESPDLLDLGTGGGEWLASLSYRPVRCVATESWPPNAAAARRRLEPLGVDVRTVQPFPDNNEQTDAVDVVLPFDDASFHLVCSRHESFGAPEVARVLDVGGSFATQQMGDGRFQAFRALFNAPPSPRAPLTLPMLCAQVRQCGLDVVASGETTVTTRFQDVGALVWYLRMVPWLVPEFDVTHEHEALRRIHEQITRDGPLCVAQPCVYLVATKN
jgi:SAM-dependent methyltransferase